ncbi:hypothetical protein STEG23_011639 [Scotinomys teguina]
MTVKPLGRDQDYSLKNREQNVPWFLDPGGWGKASTVRLYFIFPGICTLSLMVPTVTLKKRLPQDRRTENAIIASRRL